MRVSATIIHDIVEMGVSNELNWQPADPPDLAPFSYQHLTTLVRTDGQGDAEDASVPHQCCRVGLADMGAGQGRGAQGVQVAHPQADGAVLKTQMLSAKRKCR